MYTIEFKSYSFDNEDFETLGTISLSDSGELSYHAVDAQDNDMFEHILATDVPLYKEDGTIERITSKDDPQLWIYTLPVIFDNPYLFAVEQQKDQNE